MAIPSHKAAHFVVIEPQIFPILKIFFNAPATSQSGDFGLQSGVGGCEDEVIGQIRGGKGGAADEQGVPAIVSALMQHGRTDPIKEAGTFTSLTHRESLPRVGWQQRWYLADLQVAHSPSRYLEYDRFITGHSAYVAIVMGFQPGAQV